MKDIMTVTLSETKPGQTGNGYTPGDQATIFLDEEDGQFGFRFHGVTGHGTLYHGEDRLLGADGKAFDTKQAALKDAIEIYHWKMGC